MCTYVIWEEFWKGIELPVSPLISDCSLCKREPWHLCKGSRGLSLVSRNQFELPPLEIYIFFHSACAIQLVFLDLWLISCRHCVSKRQLHCKLKPPLNTNMYTTTHSLVTLWPKCNNCDWFTYHFWSKQEKLDPRLNLKWIFSDTHKKQNFVLKLNLVNGQISDINNFGCQHFFKSFGMPKQFFCLHPKLWA